MINGNKVVNEPGKKDVKGDDYDVEGRVGVDLFKEVLPSNNYDYYFCGPPGMMNSLFDCLREWDVPEDRIHYEAFGPATVKKKKEADDSGSNNSNKTEAGSGFTVKFSKSDKTAEWTSDSGSILDFAEEHDVDIEFGCRAGNCGTCITAVIEGDVDYLSEPGEKPETGSCLSWIHYINLRSAHGTQKEHMLIAEACRKVFTEQFPAVSEALEWV